MFGVRTLAPTSPAESPSLACRLRRRPRPPPPSHLPRPAPLPRLVCPPSDSAVRACLQPAADPQHVQRHNHGGHVSSACPRPDLQPRALPWMPLAPPSAHRPLTSRPAPHPCVSSRLHLAPIHTLSFRYIPYPFRRTQPLPRPNLQPDPPLHADCFEPPPPSGPRTALHLIALLATRQATDSLSDENKVLIRCAWEGVSVDGISVFDNEYGGEWSADNLGACSPPPSPPPPSPSPPPPSPSPPPLRLQRRVVGWWAGHRRVGRIRSIRKDIFGFLAIS